MTIYTAKKNRKIVQPVNNEGEEKAQLVRMIYNRLSENGTKQIHRNLLKAWMVKMQFDGGASFDNLFAADVFLKYLEAKGVVGNFELEHPP